MRFASMFTWMRLNDRMDEWQNSGRACVRERNKGMRKLNNLYNTNKHTIYHILPWNSEQFLRRSFRIMLKIFCLVEFKIVNLFYCANKCIELFSLSLYYTFQIFLNLKRQISLWNISAMRRFDTLGLHWGTRWRPMRITLFFHFALV